MAPRTTVEIIDKGAKAGVHEFRVTGAGPAEARGWFPAEWIEESPSLIVARIISMSQSVGHSNTLLANRKPLDWYA